MKNAIARFTITFSKLPKHHIQVFLLLLTLAMLVLGGGAPDTGGGTLGPH
jgi:hypothetical protein